MSSQKLLNRGSRWLDGKTATAGADTYKYWRGSADVDVDAVMGSTPIGFALSGTIVQSWQSTDFLVPAAQLLLGGHAIEPEKGDRIEATINGATVRFVVAQTDDQRCFRWSDPVLRETYRIHTREAA